MVLFTLRLSSGLSVLAVSENLQFYPVILLYRILEIFRSIFPRCTSMYLASKRAEIAFLTFHLIKNYVIFYITSSKIWTSCAKIICTITKIISKSWAWFRNVILGTLWCIYTNSYVLFYTKKILHTRHSNTRNFSGEYRVFTPYILSEISVRVILDTCCTRNFSPRVPTLQATSPHFGSVYICTH